MQPHPLPRSLRPLLAILAVLLLPGAALAQERPGAGELAPGWMARTDRGQDFGEVGFTETDGGVSLAVGPALILWRPEDTATGSYTVSGDFVQTSEKALSHGAGLLVGGDDLLGEGQVYTYFLVRGDGAYIVKTRDGATTAEVSDGWVPSDAIRRNRGGAASNTLAIEVGPETTRFLANGTEVHRAPTADLHTDGTWGIRLNHNLDMRVENVTATPGG